MKIHNHSQLKRQAKYIPSLALVAVSLLAAGKASAASFSFTTIADSITNGGNANSFVSFGQGLGAEGHFGSYYDLAFGASQYGISISNSSRVAYYAKTKDGVEGIYTGLNPAKNTLNDLRVIASTDKIYKSFGQGISINNQGNNKEDVAFFATLDNGESGIYLVENGQTSSTNLVNTNGILSGFAPGLSLNDNNTVAFLANLDSGGQEIFKGNGTTTTQITHCTTTNFLECPLLKVSQEENSPSINNDGTVAFASENGIFIGDGGPISIIVSDPDNFLKGSYREANINNSGWVSALTYNGDNHSGGHIIFSSDGSDGSIIVGNNITGKYASDFWYVGTSSINNNGNVAFLGNKGLNVFQHKHNEIGIYTGRDAAKDKVIAVGDYFDMIGNTKVNSKVVDLSFDRQSLNDSGEIAFWAKFENGVEGIFRSNPFGTSQFNPWMPNCKIENGSIYSFCDVTGRNWYDPPVTEGFTYKTNDESLFTSILDLPSTFENPFTVSVGDIILGQFSNGDEINFSKYADILGSFLVDGLGVKEFSVRTNDGIDPTNPMALPIKLAFNTEKANFSMYALESRKVNTIPEPGTVLGLLSIGFFLRRSGRRQQNKV